VIRPDAIAADSRTSDAADLAAAGSGSRTMTRVAASRAWSAWGRKAALEPIAKTIGGSAVGRTGRVDSKDNARARATGMPCGGCGVVCHSGRIFGAMGLCGL